MNYAQSILELELAHWKFPENCKGTLYSAEEDFLLTMMEQGYTISKTAQHLGGTMLPLYRTRSAKTGRHRDIAYHCPFCDVIVIGPPQILVNKNAHPLAGREALRYSCSNKSCEHVFA